MSHDDDEDSIPFSAPALLVDDPPPKITLAAPELSLLLDQDKSRSFQTNHSPIELPGHAKGFDKIWRSKTSDMSSKQYSTAKRSSDSRLYSSGVEGVHNVEKMGYVPSPPNTNEHRAHTQNYSPQRFISHMRDQSKLDQHSSSDFNLGSRHLSNSHENIPPRQFYQQNVQYFNDGNRYIPQSTNDQRQHSKCRSATIPFVNQIINDYQTVCQSSVGPPIVQTAQSNFKQARIIGHLAQNLSESPGTNIDQTINELYQVVHLQIQQMNAITLLQQQVKQLQLTLDSRRNIGEEQNGCKHCSCCQNSIGLDDLVKDELSSSNKNVCRESVSISTKVSPKRSLGIMENISEQDEEESSSSNEVLEKTVCKKTTKKGSSTKNKQLKQVVEKNPSRHHNVSTMTLERSKSSKPRKNCSSPQERKSTKTPLKMGRARDDHLFIEAKAVKNETKADKESSEEDCGSSSSSLHIDLQDYSSSENSIRDSSSGTDISEDSEEESSGPKLGWTFYNQVVDQVNNIVKKEPAKFQDDRRPRSRKVSTTRRKENYETENNWSKRVTFHGSSASRNEDFMLNMIPTPQHFQPIQGNQEHTDYLTNGLPERMQDLRMCNIANGNTNMSFATLRYLERYDLLPPQFNSNEQDQVYQQQDHNPARVFEMKQKNLEAYQRNDHKRRSRDSRR